MPLALEMEAARRARGASEVVSQASWRPVSLAGHVLPHLRLTSTSPDLQLVDGLATAATTAVQGYLGRDIVHTVRRVWFDAPGRVLLLPEPAQSVSSVAMRQADDTLAEVDADTYDVDLVRTSPRVVLRTGESWPTPVHSVRVLAVTYAAGWPTAIEVPEAVRQAILLLTAHFYENPQPTAIGRSVVRLPFGIESLLLPFRVRLGVA